MITIMFSLLAFMTSPDYCYQNPVYTEEKPNEKIHISELYLGGGVELLRSNETYCIIRNSKKFI